MAQGGYYQGLLGAQTQLADLEQRRRRTGLLGVQQQAAEKELAEFESTAPLRRGMQEQQLIEARQAGPQRAQLMRGRELEILGKAKELFSSVGDQQGLEQANAQFEQATSQPSPYRGKQWTPEFRARVTNDLMTIEQRVQQQAGKWQYDSARGGLVNTATGEFKPARQGGAAIGPLRDPEAMKRSEETIRSLNSYIAARDGLLSGLSQSETGPLVGRIPAVTSEQQIASGAVSAMAPVLKQLFRVAGEGVFTDRDQALLLEMVPDRADSPRARAAKMANIDRIVSAKLGMRVPPPGSPQAGPPARSSAGAGGDAGPEDRNRRASDQLSPEEAAELEALRRRFQR